MKIAVLGRSRAISEEGDEAASFLKGLTGAIANSAHKPLRHPMPLYGFPIEHSGVDVGSQSEPVE
ncbi:MAG TPA: hypothetical protein PLN33_07355 [Hyphomonadaceae bacterium]|nr:hypothetical protein [Hyphomonadaceae bacterium]